MKNEEKIINLLGLVLDKLEERGKQLDDHSKQFENIQRQLDNHTKQLDDHTKQFGSVQKQLDNHTKQLEAQGKDIREVKDTSDMLKTGLISLQRGQNQHQTMLEALFAGVQDIKETMATKRDIEQVEDLVTNMALDRLVRHNKRLNKIEEALNFSHKN